jgi:hypothetical protein
MRTMTRFLRFCFAFSWILSTPLFAQSPFDGTWKIDLDQSQSQPDVYLLKEGKYRCATCDPPLEVIADNQDHPVSGDSCYETARVRVVDDLTVEETDKRHGQAVGTSRMTVSPDGNTATVDWTNSCNSKGDVITGKDILSRVSKGPAGAHAISGSWRITKRLNRSENALLITLRLKGDTFSFADPTGQGYAAKLDGAEVPFTGDLSGTVVSVRSIGENAIEVSNKRNGKIVEIDRFVVESDGKTMTVSMEDPAGATRRFVLHKQ